MERSLLKNLNQKRSRGAVAKHTRYQSIEAGSSQKKTRREPMAEAPTKGTSTSGVDPKPVHIGSNKNEDSEIPLCLRIHWTKGPAVVMVEKLKDTAAKRKVTGDESVLTPVPTRFAPSDSLQSQRKSINHKNILSDSPVDIMSSVGVPEQSPTNGLIGAILSAAGVSLAPVSSPSPSENLYYLGDDIDRDNVHLHMTPASFHI